LYKVKLSSDASIQRLSKCSKQNIPHPTNTLCLTALSPTHPPQHRLYSLLPRLSDSPKTPRHPPHLSHPPPQHFPSLTHARPRSPARLKRTSRCATNGTSQVPGSTPPDPCSRSAAARLRRAAAHAGTFCRGAARLCPNGWVSDRLAEHGGMRRRPARRVLGLGTCVGREGGAGGGEGGRISSVWWTRVFRRESGAAASWVDRYNAALCTYRWPSCLMLPTVTTYLARSCKPIPAVQVKNQQLGSNKLRTPV